MVWVYLNYITVFMLHVTRTCGHTCLGPIKKSNCEYLFLSMSQKLKGELEGLVDSNVWC